MSAAPTRLAVAALAAAAALAACDADAEPGATIPPLYASEVVSFTVGPGAGFGADALPDVVMGAPRGKGTDAGSLDVVALGIGGEIVLGFGDRVIVDGPGPDFVVFENAFWAADDPAMAFVELGAVAVSADGVAWTSFPCDTTETADHRFPGCAGWRPVHAYPPSMDPLDAALTGGDPFDLADIGVSEARYVRITDLSSDGLPPSAGFDLDAVGLAHWRLAP